MTNSTEAKAILAQAMRREHVSQAGEDVAFVMGDLQAALSTATATEALVLIPLIGRAQELRVAIIALRDAIEVGDE